MRKLLFAATGLAIIWASCKDADNQSNTAANNDAARNSAKVHAVYKALETGDVSGMDSILAENFVDHEANHGKDVKGRDSAKAMMADFHNHVTGLKFDVVSDATADNGYMFALIKMTATAKDASMDMPAGTNMDNTSVDVVKMADGKATEHWSFPSMADMMKWMKQMPSGTAADSTHKM